MVGIVPLTANFKRTVQKFHIRFYWRDFVYKCVSLVSPVGEDFDAKREVQGKTGHQVVVERTKDDLGRPSTVVKKVTSQSRVVM